MHPQSKILICNINKIIYYKFKKATLITILESNNVYIDYQCRQGFCGFCKIKLIKGYVFYDQSMPLLAAHTIGDIFPCCCIIKGDIEISL